MNLVPKEINWNFKKSRNRSERVKIQQGSEFSGSRFNGCGFSGEFFNREPLNHAHHTAARIFPENGRT
jgi:hypothetical protein